MSDDQRPALAARIASVDDIASKLVDVPEWGGIQLLLKSPTLRRRFEYVSWKSQLEEEGTPDAMERLWLGALICCACDPETGDYAFTYEDMDLLAAKASVVVERLAFEAMSVMGLTKEAADGLKDDSSTTVSDDPSSTSQSASAEP